MKKAHPLVLKQQLKGVASHLTHTHTHTHISRSLLEHFLDMAIGRCHLHAFPLLCCSVPVTPRWELLHTFGAILCVTLDSLSLVAKGAFDPALMAL